MSANTPKADIHPQVTDVRFVPIADIRRTGCHAPALCQKQHSDRTRCTYTIVGIVGAVGFSGARWISRMSPWCTVAT